MLATPTAATFDADVTKEPAAHEEHKVVMPLPSTVCAKPPEQVHVVEPPAEVASLGHAVQDASARAVEPLGPYVLATHMLPAQLEALPATLDRR